MERVYREYRDQGLEIVAVAVDEAPGQPDEVVQGRVREFVERLGLSFPVALDPSGGTERLFDTAYLPTTVLIDRQGRIRAQEVGGRFWDREPYVDMIESLIEER